MHILLFHFDESCPASVRQTFLLARELSAGTAGDVTLVCTAGGFLEREARSVDVPVLPVGGLTGKPLTLMRLVRVVRSREASVLHCCDTASAALVRQLKRLSGGRCRTVQTWRVMGGDAARHVERVCRHADAVLCHGEMVCDRLERHGVPRSRLFAVSPAVDAGHYAPRRPRGDGRCVFVVAAPLAASSGHGIVLAAMRLLATMPGLPEWEVRLVGDGPDFASLLATARQTGVDTHLAMLGTQDERRILPDADVLLAPSLDGEHGADAIRAAWCVGLPAVASSLDVHTGMVRHDETGLLVPVGDADALAAVMARLARDVAGDGAMAAGLVAGGRAEVLRRTPERLAAAHLDIYREQAGAVRRSLQSAGV